MNIYIDESGYTGPDYVNKEQPLFVVACNWIPATTCKEVETIIRKEYNGNEIKFSKMIKTPSGQSAIINAFNLLSRNRDHYAGYVIHKKSALVRKFVDDCIDPAFVQICGGDFDATHRIVYSNLLTTTLPAFMGEEWYETFLFLYNNFIRAQNNITLDALWKHCKLADGHKDAYDMLSPFTLFPQLALNEVTPEYYKNDVYEQAVFGLVGHIRNYFDIKDFHLIYDNTSATSNESLLSFLKRMEGLERAYKLSDVCTFHPDVTISSTQSADSESQIGVQVSDVIAGAFSWTFKIPANLKTPVGNAVINSMDERNLIHMANSNNITPEELGMSGSENPWGA